MTQLRVAGLFAGIGGIERGLANEGHRTVLLNEIDAGARAILKAHFGSDLRITKDISDLKRLPQVDLVAAGFPCTDISQAGRKTGIAGPQSGLIRHVWRLIEECRRPPEWLLLENVSYMLSLGKGAGLRHLVNAVERFGYRWAYRVVDARAFGVPQRRQRIIFLASQSNDPREVLFADDSDLESEYDDRIGEVDPSAGYGFYWTEGLRGLGWTKDAVPTIKGGSSLGIPSAPAIWYPDTGEVGTPQIEDAERMQGFPADWTLPAVTEGNGPFRKNGTRWKYVGNAVCVPMSQWIGERLRSPGTPVDGDWSQTVSPGRWPRAAYGGAGKAWLAPVSTRPRQEPFGLRKFLELPLSPLSARATAGFLSRTRRGKLRFSHGFIEGLERHLESWDAG
jgi:DNA (cytosine-5)-methyltransferase 1